MGREQDLATPAVDLSDRERERAAERKAIAPLVVHEAIRIEGAEELSRPLPALAWSAVAAGLSMGFSLVAEGLLRQGLPDAPWRPLVSRLGYSVGFLVVVLGRQQLFTENTLTVILPFLDRPGLAALARVARLWAVVLGGNVVGALGFAWLCGRGAVFTPEVRAVFTAMAREAVAPGFGTLLLRGIYGGWLIALMIWLLPAAENAKLFVIVIVTWLVGVGNFAHSVAGSVEALYLVTNGALSPGAYLGGFLLPTFLGNSIGGVSLVAALNHAQVRAGARPAA